MLKKLIMQNYLSYLKIFFNSRWIFKPPKQKKILIYDGNSNPFKEYFKERDYNIFFRRGEEINLYLISKMILNLNISADSYTELFLDYAKPKIIITAIDNNHKFFLEYAKQYSLTHSQYPQKKKNKKQKKTKDEP